MQLKTYFVPAVAIAVLLMGPSCSRTPAQSKFATPDAAAKALMQALKADNMDQITAIFGRDALEAVASGDAVSDKGDREVIGLAMELSWRWSPLGSDRKELIIGDEQWPFPVPLAKSGDRWVFDAEAGKQEVLARRIGRNELDVIDLCRWYVDVQKEYAADSHDGKQAGLRGAYLAFHDSSFHSPVRPPVWSRTLPVYPSDHGIHKGVRGVRALAIYDDPDRRICLSG
jgi:hypothetical protein